MITDQDWVTIPLAARLANVDPAAILALTVHAEPLWLDGSGADEPCIACQASDDGMRVRLSDVLEMAPAMRAVFGPDWEEPA